MSAAAGALALASVLPPAAVGVAPPPGAASDAATSPFEGLLAGDGEASPLESDPLVRAEPPALDATLSPAAAVDAVVTAAPAPAPTPAVPPPMDDPATRSVLNALALRVATESQGVAAARGPAGSAGSAGEVVPAAVAALPAIATAAASPVAPSVAVAAAPLDGTLLVAATAFGAAMPGLRAAPSAGGAGTMAAPSVDAAASDGERAGALDGLLSSLEALLPSAHPKPAAAPVASAAPAVATAPAAAPTASPLAVPATPTETLASGIVQDLAAGAIDGAVADGGVDASGAPSLPSGAPVANAGPASFTSQLASAAGLPHAAARADGGQPPITVPFDSPQWGNELATRVVSLAKEQFSEAEIRVTPDELGPIEVKLRFDGDRVHAQFGAISPEAREALTANLHRLREMLAGEGLNLGQAFVGHHGQDAPRRYEGQAVRSGAGGGEDEEASAIEVRGPATLRRGLLDEFA